MTQPTKYARSEDAYIAYQAFGEGPVDLVLVPDFYSNVEQMWTIPPMAQALNRLASFSRVIMYDQRGTGLSESVHLDRLPSREQRANDLLAVLDAVDAARPALAAVSMGGPFALLFAGTYPERTSGLVLIDTTAWHLDEPRHVYTPEAMDQCAIDAEGIWGRGERLRPWGMNWDNRLESISEDLHRYQRMSISPRLAAKLWRNQMELDVRDVLESIDTPTLVLQHEASSPSPAEHGRQLAERIREAKLIDLIGLSTIWPFAILEVADEIEEFLTGTKPARTKPSRGLATVLFTDVVSSTATAAKIGDRNWREVVEGHAASIRRHVERHDGRLITAAGEESLSTFDSPARAIRCAFAIRRALGELGLKIRSGVHAGEIEILDGGVGGLSVHIGARVCALAGPDEVLVSSTVKDLVVGSGIEFDDRGTHALKGVPDEWRIYAVRG